MLKLAKGAVESHLQSITIFTERYIDESNVPQMIHANCGLVSFKKNGMVNKSPKNGELAINTALMGDFPTKTYLRFFLLKLIERL